MADFDTLGWDLARACGAVYAKDGTGSTTNEVMTGVRFTQQKLRAVNNCTFLFDPTYTANFDGTFPLSFFWVKGMTERMDSKVTNKTIIFFDETLSSESGADVAKTQVVSDNIVISPKEYTLDVIIPYGMGQILTNRSTLDATTDVAVMSVQSNKGTYFAKSLTGFNQAVGIMSEIVKTLVDMTEAVASVDFKGGVTGMVSSILGEKNYNKNSLEAMWRNRSICTMKTWDDWKYKYVAITGLAINKQPTDDNVYEGQITVREVPILTFRKEGTIKKKNNIKSKLKEKKVRTYVISTESVLKTMNESQGIFDTISRMSM